MENVKRFSQLEENPNTNKDIRLLCEHLEKYSYDEYQRFFQMLGNFQHITSNESHSLQLGNKDIITIDEKRINYNENDLSWVGGYIDINNLIKRKDFPIKYFAKEEEHDIFRQPSMDESSTILHSQNEQNVMRSIFENIMINLKKVISSESNVIALVKNVIKIYSYFIYHNQNLKYDKEDILLIDLIKENCFGSFYNISKYWLYEDFLINEENRRYETILAKILTKIEEDKDKFQLILCKDEWKNFIEGLPRFTEKVLDHVFKILKDNIELYRKNEASKTKEDNSMILRIFNILLSMFIKIKRKSSGDMVKIYLDLADQILRKFFEIFKINEIKLIKVALQFLADKFYPYEPEKVKEFAKNQFMELKNLTASASKETIMCKYPLFFYLCKYDPELVMVIPEVYSEMIPTSRTILDKHLGNIIKKLDTLQSAKLVTRCTEECLSIILIVIDNIKIEQNSISLTKLISKIKYFYEKSNEKHLEILLTLVEKIPISLFFSSFVFEKIKKIDSFLVDNNLKIFNKINNNDKNETLFENEYFKFDINVDRVIFYIAYYVLVNEKSSTPKFDSDLNLLFKYYKMLKTEKVTESLNFMFDSFINIEIKKDSNLLALAIITYENFKDNTNIKSLILSNIT
jgi:hypothetical protein